MKNRSPAIFAALTAAILFGASTPFAKQLVSGIPPILLAGLLYLGSGLGLFIFRFAKDFSWQPTGLLKKDGYWLIASIIFGGIFAPILLMTGLIHTEATTTSLLLNLESVFTALMAWIIFKEHTHRWIICGMLLMVVGGVILTWPSRLIFSSWSSPWLIIAACACWAIDNNLTRKISASDPLFLAGTKGLTAGVVNTSLAFSLGLHLPTLIHISYALFIGFLGYGMSLVLFVLALRGLGTARTSAYFSIAPFIGAAVAILFFHEPTTLSFWIAALLMIIGTCLHLIETHHHTHTHEALFHSHRHSHDAHHQHSHDFDWDNKKPHTHAHQHAEITHAHPHYPDIHHRHDH